jgi:hypothetical protein
MRNLSTPVTTPATPAPPASRAILARLIERGTNFRQFALSHGYKPRTVTQAVDRWAGQRELPQGRLTFRILRDLSKAAGVEVIPGILADDPDAACREHHEQP